MDLVRTIAGRSLLMLAAAAAAAAFIDWQRFMPGVIVGGALGIINVRAMAWGVSGLASSGKATGRLLFFSQFRLVMLFMIMALLVYFRIVDVLGLLVGFTIVFANVLIEGLRYAKRQQEDSRRET